MLAKRKERQGLVSRGFCVSNDEQAVHHAVPD
jgi:hypothetical protein